MPLYEYLCHDCDHPAELLVRAGQQPACPRCGSPKLTKLLSMVAAPTRSTPGSDRPDLPPGACGSSCACFPTN